MIHRTVTMPIIGLIAGTRMALGAGIGLLLADRLNQEQRRAVGWTLLAVGALTTIPLALEALSGAESSDGASGDASEHQESAPKSQRRGRRISS